MGGRSGTPKIQIGFKPSNWYLPVKYWLSILLAIPLSVVLLPPILLMWLAVRLTSRGPGFYSQVRLGLGGRLFRIHKLRTMVVDAEARSGPVWATRDDPRITSVGRFLRRFHLDELPQIVNVLAGDMSFVGPRPERPEIAATLTRKVRNYYDRLAVKPGITGMAQLQLPPDSCLESVCNKLSYDLTYIDRATPWLDAKLFFATFFKAIPFASWMAKKISRSPRFEAAAKEVLVHVRCGVSPSKSGSSSNLAQLLAGGPIVEMS